MLQKEDESSSTSGSSHNISLVFEKRTGTTDRGKDYEHQYVTHLVLKLVTNHKIEDFYLSSNDKKFGSFDDVVLKIKYHDKDTTETYAIQLKQSKNTVIRTRDLTSEKGNFSIRQYLEDYDKNLSHISNLKLILFTNSKTQIDNDFKIKVDNELLDFHVQTVTQDDLLSTHKQPWCYKFTTTADKHKEFFENFSLYSAQADVDRLEKLTSGSFGDVFKSDETSFREYVNFISRWSLKGGSKEKLTKKWMQYVTALCVLGRFIKPLSFCDSGGVNDKEQTVCEVVSHLGITTVASDNYEKIKTLWRNVPLQLDDDDMKQLEKTRIKYQIRCQFKEKADFCKVDKELCKLLWLLRKCPLILEEHPAVYQAMRLCKDNTFIVLSSNLQRTIASLSSDLYDKVLSNFTYSIEGQKEETLKDLNLGPKFHSTITIDKLIQMLDSPLVIGPPKALIPPCHVTRTLWKVFLNLNFLKESANILIISGVPNINIFCIRFDHVEVIDLDSGARFDSCQATNGSVVYLSQRVLTQEEFDRFCATKKRRCYQFKYLEECFEWVRSNNIEEVKKYRLHHEYINDGVSENDLFGAGENSVNIVCANSGMGKSTLMKSLKRGSSSKTWTILLYARKYALFCRQKVDIGNFLTNLADDICQNYLDAGIFKELMSMRRVRIVWDGLDEVSSESLDAIINIIKEISTTQIKQWITARDNIKKLLETKLQTFSFRIKQFNGEEQRIYIQERLNFTDSEMFEIFKTVQTKMQPFCNSDILGIPLQIYMLTELFSRNKEKYLELMNRTFTLLDLYESFVKEKFYVYYVEKLKLDLSIEDNHRKFVREVEQRLEDYKRVAFDAYLRTKGVFAYFQKPDDFLLDVKSKGDSVGFISTVSDDMVPEFVHNSFGEYFAASYLFDNDPSKAKDPKFTQNDDYNNIRFFLDMMLTKTSKVHLAVLNKNSILLDECSEEELKMKDLIDRGVLELSCSWSRQYKIAKIQRMGFGRFNIYSRYVDDTAKRLQYGDIWRDFAKVEDVRMEKLLLLLPFLVSTYAKLRLDDECAAMVIYYSIVFDYVVIFKYVDDIPELKRTYHNFHPIYLFSVALIYESRQCLQEFALRKQFRDALRNNLHILLYSCQFQGEEIFSLLAQHVIDINELIYYACCQGNLSNVHFLVKKGVKTHLTDAHGRTPIHYSADNEIDGFRILEFLLLKGESAHVFDNKKRTPLHYACMNGYYGPKIVDLLDNTHINRVDVYNRVPLHYACDNEDSGYYIAQILIEKGATANIVDENGLTPLHYACMNWKQGAKIVKLLSQIGTRKTVQDFKGRTPLHYACKNYFLGFKIVDVLVDSTLADTEDFGGRVPLHYACGSGTAFTVKILMRHSTRIDANDEEGQTPLHNACKNYFDGCKIVQLLLDKGAKVDSADSTGRQPLHYACEFGKPETVSFLLSHGAKVNKVDTRGRLPIHYACMNIYHSLENVKLLLNAGQKWDVRDKTGRMPIHYACETGNIYNVMMLINEMGSDINVSDLEGRKPVDYAQMGKNYNVVQLLRNVEDGGDLEVPL